MKFLKYSAPAAAYLALFGLSCWCAVLSVYEYGWWSAAVVAALVAAFPLSSLLHELGHMLFGAMAKVKAVPRFGFLNSSCVEIIPKTDKNLKGRIIFTSLGGLAVNLVFAVLGFVAVFAEAVPLYLCAFMPASVFFIIMNGFPLEYGNGKTDAAVIAEFLKNTDEAKVALAVLTVQARVLKGEPIENTDENLLFGVPVIREDDPAFISLTQLRYEYFSAKGDTAKAEEYRRRLEELKEYL